MDNPLSDASDGEGLSAYCGNGGFCACAHCGIHAVKMDSIRYQV